MKPSRAATVSRLATVAVFVAVLVAPQVTDGADDADAQLQEGRELAPEPELPDDWATLSDYPSAYEAYYADRFGGRRTLLDAWRHLVLWLGSSPTDQVVLGVDGWLFYTQNGILDDYRGEATLSPWELRQWQTALTERRTRAAASGAEFLFAVAPNKVTIYPDKLQPIDRNTTAQPTRLDGLVDHLDRASDFDLVDLRVPLRAAARERQVYLATDSHWNHHGAFVAYRALVEAMRRRGVAVDPLREDQLRASEVVVPGDLARLLGVDDIPPERRVRLPVGPDLPARKLEVPELLAEMSRRVGAWEDPILYECPEAEGVLLMFRDSFAWPMIPWLAQHFRYSIFVSRWPMEFDEFEEWIELVHPTVVLEMRVERNVLWRLRTDPRR